jgi:hypothetical protein
MPQVSLPMNTTIGRPASANATRVRDDVAAKATPPTIVDRLLSIEEFSSWGMAHAVNMICAMEGRKGAHRIVTRPDYRAAATSLKRRKVSI